MKIYLVRHGQTLQNKKGTYYGNLDVELNEDGIKQIKNLSKSFLDINFDKIYISDTKRAYQTAELILNNKTHDFIKDSRLRETNFGDFEGKNFDEISKKYPTECKKWIDDWKHFCPPNGESYKQMYFRVREFFNDLIKHDYENVLIVTHSGVIKAFLCFIMNDNMDLFWKFSCKNGDVVIVKYEYQNFYLDSITHLNFK